MTRSALLILISALLLGFVAFVRFEQTDPCVRRYNLEQEYGTSNPMPEDARQRLEAAVDQCRRLVQNPAPVPNGFTE